ncbi:hypothetical protein ACUOCP_43105, partial [Escherichia sp. R-CC3]
MDPGAVFVATALAAAIGALIPIPGAKAIGYFAKIPIINEPIAAANAVATNTAPGSIPVYRDEAPTIANYPYIVYEFVNEQHKRASNKVLKDMPLYQIAVITNGTEKDY